MARPKRDVERVNFYIQSKTLTGLRALAKLRATSMSNLLREALREWVGREMKKEKENARAARSSADAGDGVEGQPSSDGVDSEPKTA